MTEPARATKKTTSKASTRTAKAAPATARCPLLLQKDERGASESAYIPCRGRSFMQPHHRGRAKYTRQFFLNTHYIFGKDEVISVTKTTFPRWRVNIWNVLPRGNTHRVCMHIFISVLDSWVMQNCEITAKIETLFPFNISEIELSTIFFKIVSLNHFDCHAQNNISVGLSILS